MELLNSGLEVLLGDNNNFKEQLEKESMVSNPNVKEITKIKKLYNESEKRIVELKNRITNWNSESFVSNDKNIGLQRMIEINKYENSRLESQKYILKVIAFSNLIIFIFISTIRLVPGLGIFKYLGVIIVIGVMFILIGKEYNLNSKRDLNNWDNFNWGEGVPDNKTSSGVRYGSDSVDIVSGASSTGASSTGASSTGASSSTGDIPEGAPSTCFSSTQKCNEMSETLLDSTCNCCFGWQCKSGNCSPPKPPKKFNGMSVGKCVI
jgi:hypothetical protein